MDSEPYRYRFNPDVDIDEVGATLTLSILAVEGLHGQSQVQLEAHHSFDAVNRTCLIDASGEVGRDLNRLFLGFLNREFGR